MAFNLAETATQTGMIIVLTLMAVFIIAVIAGAFWLIQRQKQWKKYRVVIWKRYSTQDGRTIPMVVDLTERGRVTKDRKLNKWVFHLKKANLDLGEEELEGYDEDRELDLPTVPYSEGGEVLFIEQLAKRKYAIGDPYVIEGNVTIRVTSADLAEAMRAYDVNARTFGKKDHSIWAFAIYVVFAVLILILIAVVLNKLENLNQFGEQWVEGARMMAGTQSQTVPSTVLG